MALFQKTLARLRQAAAVGGRVLLQQRPQRPSTPTSVADPSIVSSRAPAVPAETLRAEFTPIRAQAPKPTPVSRPVGIREILREIPGTLKRGIVATPEKIERGVERAADIVGAPGRAFGQGLDVLGITEALRGLGELAEPLRPLVGGRVTEALKTTPEMLARIPEYAFTGPSEAVRQIPKTAKAKSLKEFLGVPTTKEGLLETLGGKGIIGGGLNLALSAGDIAAVRGIAAARRSAPRALPKAEEMFSKPAFLPNPDVPVNPRDVKIVDPATPGIPGPVPAMIQKGSYGDLASAREAKAFLEGDVPGVKIGIVETPDGFHRLYTQVHGEELQQRAVRAFIDRGGPDVRRITEPISEIEREALASSIAGEGVAPGRILEQPPMTSPLLPESGVGLPVGGFEPPPDRGTPFGLIPSVPPRASRARDILDELFGPAAPGQKVDVTPAVEPPSVVAPRVTGRIEVPEPRVTEPERIFPSVTKLPEQETIQAMRETPAIAQRFEETGGRGAHTREAAEARIAASGVSEEAFTKSLEKVRANDPVASDQIYRAGDLAERLIQEGKFDDAAKVVNALDKFQNQAGGSLYAASDLAKSNGKLANALSAKLKESSKLKEIDALEEAIQRAPEQERAVFEAQRGEKIQELRKLQEKTEQAIRGTETALERAASGAKIPWSKAIGVWARMNGNTAISYVRNSALADPIARLRDLSTNSIPAMLQQANTFFGSFARSATKGSGFASSMAEWVRLRSALRRAPSRTMKAKAEAFAKLVDGPAGPSVRKYEEGSGAMEEVLSSRLTKYLKDGYDVGPVVSSMKRRGYSVVITNSDAVKVLEPQRKVLSIPTKLAAGADIVWVRPMQDAEVAIRLQTLADELAKTGGDRKQIIDGLTSLYTRDQEAFFKQFPDVAGDVTLAVDTYLNRQELGKAGQLFLNAARLNPVPGLRVVGNTLVPFGKFAINSTKQGLGRLLFGNLPDLTELGRLKRPATGATRAADLAQAYNAVGKVIGGTAAISGLIATYSSLLDAGWAVTGAYPTSSRDKQLFAAKQWKPYSLVSPDGGTSVNYMLLPVVGPAFAGIRELESANERRKQDGITAALMRLGGGLATLALTGSPAFTGLEKIVEALAEREDDGSIDPEAVANAVASAAGITVPQFIGRLSSFMDPWIRETKGGTPAETTLRSVQARIPGLREKLPKRPNVFGEAQPQKKLPDLLSAGLVQGLVPSERAKRITRLGLTVAKPTATDPSSGTFTEYALTKEQKKDLENTLKTATGNAADQFLEKEQRGEYRALYDTLSGSGVLKREVTYKSYLQKKLDDLVTARRKASKAQWKEEHAEELEAQEEVKSKYQ